MSTHTVSVVGIGVRLPGHIATPDELAQALAGHHSVVDPLPEERWERLVAEVHPDQRPRRRWHGGTLTDHNWGLDRWHFGISADEAEQMDPQQRLALELVWEALADAGIRPSSLAGTDTGVYAGAAGVDHAGRVFAPGVRTTPHTGQSGALSIIANRVSYHLGVHGPSFVVDSACSASAVALHLAARDLADGTVGTAVVLGVNSLDSAAINAYFHQVDGVMAPDGVCSPFSRAAHGYVRSEGGGALILRRTTDLTPGTREWVRLLGSAVTHDGRTPHLIAPNGHAQAKAITRALNAAGLTPEQVGAVFGHATGTAAGDAQELRGVAEAYRTRDREQPLLLTSVKPGLGHTEAASGVVNVMCAAVGARAGRIWPTLNHTDPVALVGNRRITVPTRAVDWPTGTDGTPAAVGVSAFGFGGTNAHLILAPAPEPQPASKRAPAAPVVIPLSGHTRQVLTRTAARWAPAVAALEDLVPVGAAALWGRDHDPRHRAAVVARTPGEAAEALHAIASGLPHQNILGPLAAHGPRERLVGVMSGHGTHHQHMAVELAATIPVFAAAVDRGRAALQPFVDGPVWAPGAPLEGFEQIQHAGWLVQVALADTLTAWGIAPDVWVGHSAGEVAAAYAAGALTLEQSARVIGARSRLLAALSGKGGMLAVGLPADQAEAVAAEHGVDVAVVNSPRLSVLSGATADLAAAAVALERVGVWAKAIRDVVPAHSPAVTPLQEALRQELDTLEPSAPTALMVSTATGAPATGLDADYWAYQLRARVRFADVIGRLTEGRPTGVVEVGARAVLAGHITDTAPGTPVATATTDPDELFRAVAGLYVHGHTPTGPATPGEERAELPPAVWQRTGAEDRTHVDLPAAATWTAQDHGRVTGLVLALATRTIGTAPGSVDVSWAEAGVTSLDLVGVLAHLRTAHPAWATESVTDLAADATIATTVERLTALLPRTEAIVPTP